MNSSPGYRILILEDDDALRAVMRDFLTLMDYQVIEASDLSGFRQLSAQQNFDLLLLDLNLPDGDGLTLLKSLTAAGNTPVFVVSGRCDEHSRLQALEAGADDYIIKPFNARELEFRIRNFLRRQGVRQSTGAEQPLAPLTFGEWRLQPNQYRITGPQGAFISLTRSERDLLRELMQANGNLCSRRQLARAMSSTMETTSEETVTVLIYRLRKKLEAAGIPAPMIETVAGAGYRFAGAGQ